MYTPLQQEEIRNDLARLRIAEVVLGVLIAPLLFLGVALPRHYHAQVSFFGYPSGTIKLAAGAVVLVLLAFGAWLWRCPGCRERLPPEFRPEKCPNCEVRFRD
jgi:hypothetical protein